MHIPPLLDFEEGTERYSSVGSFDNYGFVSIQPHNIRYKLPPADPQVDYILSKVESIQNRRDAIKRLETVLPDAKNAYENGDYQTVFSLLSPLMDDGTLLRSDEAVLLWEKLYPYFHPLNLVNVIPDEHFSGEAFITYKDLIISNTPPDEKTEEVDVTSDGVTRVYSKEEDYFWRENYSGGIDWEFHFSMRAEDIRSGKEWYSSKSFFDSYETEDYTPMDHGLYMKLRHNFIWFWRLRTAGRYNLGDPDVQRKIDLRFMLPGTGAYTLRNTEDGMYIGDFFFDDEYQGFEPLIDKQRICCKNKSYRLIYQYGEMCTPEECAQRAEVISFPTIREGKKVTPKPLITEPSPAHDPPEVERTEKAAHPSTTSKLSPEKKKGFFARLFGKK